MRSATAAILLATTIGVATAPCARAAELPGSAPMAPAIAGRNDGLPFDRRLLSIGLGAVTGAAAFNVLTAPLGVVPLAGGTLARVPYSVALGSRLIAVASAGVGALGANWLYDRWTGEQGNGTYLATLAAGALVGVAAGNYLTIGALGVPPYYAGAGVAYATGALASPAAQAASRVVVVGTATLGAWAADWYYRR
jgi:hypothetical protein